MDGTTARLDAIAGMQAQNQRLLERIATQLGMTYDPDYGTAAVTITLADLDPTRLLPGDVVVALNEHEEEGCHCDVLVTVRRRQ